VILTQSPLEIALVCFRTRHLDHRYAFRHRSEDHVGQVKTRPDRGRRSDRATDHEGSKRNPSWIGCNFLGTFDYSRHCRNKLAIDRQLSIEKVDGVEYREDRRRPQALMLGPTYLLLQNIGATIPKRSEEALNEVEL